MPATILKLRKADTLRDYFLTVFQPEQLAGKHRVYCHQYLSAISCLEACVSVRAGTLAVDAVSELDLELMKGMCNADGYAPVTVAKYVWLIRMVLRHARPADFPQLKGRWKRPPKGVPPVDEPGTLLHFFLHTYEPHRLLARTEGTADQFRIAITRLCTFKSNARLTVLDLSNDLLMDFAGACKAEGLSIETINSRLSKLKAIWRFAVRRKLRVDGPDTERLPTMKRLPQAWTMEQMGGLLRACDQMQGSIGGVEAALYWRALLLVLYDTGVRLRAARLLPRACVDLKTRCLRVPAELMKNRREQLFWLSEQTAMALAVIDTERELLFPCQWHKRTLYKHYHRLLTLAGLPSGRRDLFHKVRRTSATHLAAAVGIEHASRHLGHSSLQVTAAYIDTAMMPSVRAGEVLPRPVMPS